MQPWKTREELEHQVVTLTGQGLSRRATARTLKVSRNTVRKILTVHGKARQQASSVLAAPPERAPRPSKLDAFKGKISELLARMPEMTAQRIFEELRAHDYGGGYTAVKEHVREIRPKALPQPSLPTPIHGPGEMAESDWSPYAIDFLNGEHALVQIFSYILNWSTRKYFGVYERSDLFALMDGHTATFNRFGGAARKCKYDCQKAVVLGWEGQQPLYNPRFLAFATYYEFRPQACRPGHPNDKPKVERGFWEFERSFLNGRRFRDMADLLQQLSVWLDSTADTRVHRKLKRSSLEAFAEEKPHLVPLPAHPYDTARVVYRVCSIDGFVSFNGNRYAVPYEQVTDLLPLRITQRELFIYSADLSQVARHELAPRGAGLDVPPGGHLPASHRGGADLEQLEQAFRGLGDEGERFFTGLRTSQGRAAGHHARQILLLRESFTTADLCAALGHARSFGAFEHRSIERILAVRAKPRRLAEYVVEEFARKLDEPGPDSHLRDLDEYDSLPITARPKEDSCPDASNPQQPTTPSSGSGDTSSSSG
jgi:transposase